MPVCDEQNSSVQGYNAWAQAVLGYADLPKFPKKSQAANVVRQRNRDIERRFPKDRCCFVVRQEREM
ncbi:MAG: hypothetical protein JWO95_3306 [Verrucomicrobiales bacterium]|nr:hypothetical protein [Verrucomicrobiales bacterium]